MSKRTQSSVLETIQSLNKEKVTPSEIIAAHGLPQSEVERLIDAMVKNWKLVYEGGYIWINEQKAKIKKLAAEEEVLERKQRNPSPAMGLYPDKADTMDARIRVEIAFRAKHGYDPDQVEWTGSAFLAGPIKDARGA